MWVNICTLIVLSLAAIWYLVVEFRGWREIHRIRLLIKEIEEKIANESS